MTSDTLTKLANRIESHTSREGMHQSAIPGLELYRFSAPTNPEAVLCEPSLCVIAQGTKEVLLAGKKYRYDPARFLLVSVGLPLISSVIKASSECPCLVVRIKLDPALITDILTQIGTVAPTRPTNTGLAVCTIDPLLLDAVTRLVVLLDTPQDLDLLAPLIVREITYRTIMSPQGETLRQSAIMGLPTHRISHTIKWIAKHFTEPFKIESLAKQVGMSTSSLHSHFKKVTGYSPLNFQKQLRLQEARQLMIREGLDAAEAAFRVGYESPSQFGREYKRLFGKPPRRDTYATTSSIGDRIS